ncbi:MAG: hypothetical protein QN194_15880 [Armatimonadota bacterium]|nr:hypothetical protein [Armatimonadota bacterium]
MMVRILTYPELIRIVVTARVPLAATLLRCRPGGFPDERVEVNHFDTLTLFWPAADYEYSVILWEDGDPPVFLGMVRVTEDKLIARSTRAGRIEVQDHGSGRAVEVAPEG